MIVLLGAGRETQALAQRLRREQPDADLAVFDEATPAPDALAMLQAIDVAVHARIDLDDADALPTHAQAVYRSPGISPYRPAVARLIMAGVRVTTPTGWWVAHRDNGDVVAITGTKGKSTTAAMTAHLLRAAGRQVALVGNIGRPALEADEEAETADDVVLELSSYQLADLDVDRPFAVGAVTTLLRDHVPWHGSEARYHDDKLRLLTLARVRLASRSLADHPALERAGGVDLVTCDAAREPIRAALAAADLHGEHLVDDALVALTAVDARLGRPEGCAPLIEALRSFDPLPHRQTPVATIAGRQYVDDSISTIPESAIAAVRTHLVRGPVTVLLGGDDRGQDLAALVELLRDAQVRAVLLGPLAQRLAPALAFAEDRVHQASDLERAVTIAEQVTPPGGTVLLSPAAPSFHAYRDFAARGEHFVALVRALVRP